jgi:aryl-alcohol dehydrogenase-like predicted oxidoreductase
VRVEYRSLGRTGLRVSQLALGTAVLGLAPREDGVDDLISAALDAGINLFDCANTYGNRPQFDRDGAPSAADRKHAEELLGRALGRRRDDVVLCTKVGEPVGEGINDRGASRLHIMREAEASLRRLGTDRIDVYHLHLPDPETPVDETLGALDDLVRQGKVRYVGLSRFSGWQLTHAVMTADHLGLSRPVLDQVAYSMINRGCEAEIVPAALELGVSITCFSPLAGGALAGPDVMARTYSGYRRWGAPFDYTAEQKSAALELGRLAESWGVAAAHLALRWLLSRPAVAAAIVGPESPDELRASAAAFDVSLDAAQLEELDDVGRTVPGMPG